MAPTGHIHDPDLAEKILNGHRLRVFLEPDQTLFSKSGGMPDYIECYNLPIVSIQGDRFWGMTRSTHLIIDKNHNVVQVCSFAYTNAVPVYSIVFNDETLKALGKGKVVAKLMSAMQYLEMRFITAEPGQLVWRDDEPNNTRAVADCIHRGDHFYAVAELDDRRALSLPLDLAFFTTADNGLDFRSEVRLVPSFIPEIDAFVDSMAAEAQSKSISLDETLLNPQFNMESEFQASLIYYRFYLDRTYAMVPNVMKDERVPLKSLKVFAYP